MHRFIAVAITSIIESMEWASNLTLLTNLITSSLSSCLGLRGRQLSSFFKEALENSKVCAELGPEGERPQYKTIPKSILQIPFWEFR